jgi:hypothetical protein
MDSHRQRPVAVDSGRGPPEMDQLTIRILGLGRCQVKIAKDSGANSLHSALNLNRIGEPGRRASLNEAQIDSMITLLYRSNSPSQLIGVFVFAYSPSNIDMATSAISNLIARGLAGRR